MITVISMIFVLHTRIIAAFKPISERENVTTVKYHLPLISYENFQKIINIYSTRVSGKWCKIWTNSKVHIPKTFPQDLCVLMTFSRVIITTKCVFLLI